VQDPVILVSTTDRTGIAEVDSMTTYLEDSEGTVNPSTIKGNTASFQ
jgi:hypothetical protein